MSDYQQNLLAIVGATFLSELVTHPFEVVKVRAQIKFNKSGETPSRLKLVRRYIETSGFTNLYKGFSPGILRAVQNQTLRLYLYSEFNKLLPQPPQTDGTANPWKQLPTKFVSAFMSSFVAGLTGNPWVILKVRMIADRTGDYKNLKKAFSTIVRKDGYREFTKGTSITIARGILLSTVELTTYDTLKYVLKTKEGHDSRAYFLASLISSFVAAFSSYPLDMIITLYMHQSSQAQKQKGLKEIATLAKHIYSKNGLKGFYVGFLGFASRSMVYGPVFWNSLEYFNQLSAEKFHTF